jgi:hypothetical protein
MSVEKSALILSSTDPFLTEHVLNTIKPLMKDRPLFAQLSHFPAHFFRICPWTRRYPPIYPEVVVTAHLPPVVFVVLHYQQEVL